MRKCIGKEIDSLCNDLANAAIHHDSSRPSIPVGVSDSDVGGPAGIHGSGWLVSARGNTMPCNMLQFTKCLNC